MKTSDEIVRPKARGLTLTKTRNLKMSRSSHAYVRGSTVKFYEWLEEQKKGSLPDGPPVWICGDCHVGNLGPVANSTGRIGVQIRDLDQTVIGNPAHDLIRLGLSLASAARGSDLPGVTTAKMLEQMMEGYEKSFEPDFQEESAGGDPRRHQEGRRRFMEDPGRRAHQRCRADHPDREALLADYQAGGTRDQEAVRRRRDAQAGDHAAVEKG